jgi:thymidine phosphorylase
LVQAHLFHTEKGARDQLIKTLTDGSAKAKFGQMVAAQKGPANFADRWEDYLTIAPSNEVLATHDGYIHEIDGTALGQIVVELGGGRQREDDRIDHSVGLSEIAPLGKKMKKGQPIALLHCSEKTIGPKITKAVQNAIVLGSEAPTLRTLILKQISP